MSWRDKKSNTALKLSPEEIQRNLDIVGLQKGIDAEDFVEKAIVLLWSQGWVQWYHRGRRWGEVDLLGMDFLLRFTTHASARFPLQVKSSEFGKKEHIAQYGDSIPCVVRYPLDTVETMAAKILMAIFPEFYQEGDLIETIQLDATDTNLPDTSFEEEPPEPLTISLGEIMI